MNMSEYDFFVFDCDGVILDSNSIKTDAFRRALPREPLADVEKLIEFHLSHGGVTRQKKFEYYFHEIKNNYDSRLMLEALDAFSMICSKHLRDADLVPGVENFLKKIKVPVYVVTGGNEQEVKGIFEHKGLSRYFDSILGNPSSKDKNMSLLKSKKYFVGNGLYFGDAKLDCELANKYGLDFVFISGFSEWKEGGEFCKDKGLLSMTDFLLVE